MRHLRPSTCKSIGKYLILKSGPIENGWGCRKEHSRKRKKHVFSATDLPYPGELRSSKGACPTSSHGEVSNSKESASGRMPDRLLELGGWISGQWKVVNRYIFNYMYMIYLRSCSWKDFEVYFEAFWMEKKEICKQAKAGVKPQNPAFYWSSQNTVRILAISIKLSPYIYIYI